MPVHQQERQAGDGMSIRYTLWHGPDRQRYMANLRASLDGLDPEKDWDVEIKLHRHAKTTSQRNWFHALCEKFGDRIGLTKGQVKELVKGTEFGWRTVVVSGIKFPIADGSSEDLDRIGYAKMTDTLYRIASESGEVLPGPDRNRGEN